VRVDGRDLRCKVVGEGGNLGLTQQGRIEAARHGVRLNNDAVDNSAGVDTSDHEVNIKILLDDVVRRGDLTAKQRSQMLHAMTGDVAELVLQHNYGQNLALGISRAQAVTLLNVHGRMIRELSAAGALDRSLEYLPDDDDLREREVNHQGLTSPELCVLLAYSKMTLASALPPQDLAGDPYFQSILVRYFPPLLSGRFADLLPEHPLAAEIIRTVVINDLVDRAGVSFVHRAAEETGAEPMDIVRGYTFTRDVFDLPQLWRQVRELDNQVSTAAQDKIYLETRRLLDRATRWLLQTHAAALDLTREVSRYGPVVRKLSPELKHLLRGAELARLQTLTDQMLVLGVPQSLADETASLLYRFMLLDVVRVAERTKAPPLDVAAMYFCLSERYDVDDFLTRISTLPRTGRWEALARQALRSDLYSALAALTAQVIRSTDPDSETVARCDTWEQANPSEVGRTRATLQEIAGLEGHDLASLSVALRALRTLVAQARGV
jgi:glutamate dehydrogenase